MACTWKIKFPSGPLSKGIFESQNDGLSLAWNTSVKKFSCVKNKRGTWELARDFESEEKQLLPLYCTWKGGKRAKKVVQHQIVDFQITKFNPDLADYVLEFESKPETQSWLQGAEIFRHLIEGDPEKTDVVNELLFPELGYTTNVAQYICNNAANPIFAEWVEHAYTYIYMTNGDDSLAEIANNFIFEGKLERFTVQLAKNMVEHSDWPQFQDWKEAETVLYLTGGDETLIDLANEFIIEARLPSLTIQIAENIMAHREWPQFSNWLETCQTFLFITEGDPELTEIANKLLFSGEELTALSEPLARNILNHGEWPFFSSILLRAQLFLFMAEEKGDHAIINCVIFEHCPNDRIERCSQFFKVLTDGGFGDIAPEFMLFTGAFIMEDALYITKDVVEKYSAEKRKLTHVKEKRLLELCQGKKDNAANGAFVWDSGMFGSARKILDVLVGAVEMGEQCGPHIEKLNQENSRLKNTIAQIKLSHARLETQLQNQINTHTDQSAKLSLMLSRSQQQVEEAQDEIKHLKIENKLYAQEISRWKGEGLDSLGLDMLNDMQKQMKVAMEHLQTAITAKKALEKKRLMRREKAASLRNSMRISAQKPE